MRDFAWPLRNRQGGVHDYFKLKITDGIVAGLNQVASNRVFLGPETHQATGSTLSLTRPPQERPHFHDLQNVRFPWVSRPREFHPQPLRKPDVNLSAQPRNFLACTFS